MTSEAVVLVDLPIPRDLAGGALIEVEAAAVCGSDWAHYSDDEFRTGRNVVLGHENVGRIVAVDPEWEHRWGLAVGDRVAVEEFVPCGRCALCREGSYHLCGATDWRRGDSLRYGRTATEVWPGLWGGFSQYLYVHPRAFVYRVPDGMDPHIAVLANPVANGIRWLYDIAGLRPGERVAIIGPGPHGLGCVLAASRVAAEVTVVGREGDERRLADAMAMGADVTHSSDGQDITELLLANDAAGPDVVVDLTPSWDVVASAIAAAPKKGRLILAGKKPATAFHLDSVAIGRKELQVRGVAGSSQCIRSALELIRQSSERAAAIDTVTFGLRDAEEAILTVGRRGSRESTHTLVVPNA